MRSEHRDLAKDLVSLRETYLGEHYRELNSDLNKALAGSGQETSPEEALENARMLSDVVGLLPKKQAREVVVQDVAEARKVQATVIWAETDRRDWEITPAYLLGTYACKNSVNLLLCDVKSSDNDSSPTNSQGDIRIATKVPAKPFAKAIDYMQRLRTSAVTEEELNQLTRGVGYSITPYDSSVTLRAIGRFQNLIYRDESMPLSAAGGIRRVTALSNDTMARFNVLDYVADLAVTFDKTAEVNKVIESRTSE